MSHNANTRLRDLCWPVETPRHPVGTVLLWFAVTRVLVVLVGMLGRLWPVPRVEVAWTDPQYGGNFHGPPSVVIESFFRWDAFWYLGLAQNGYPEPASFPVELSQIPGDVAFFPVFPLVLRAVSSVTGELFWSSVLVAHLASLGAVLFMLAYATRVGGSTLAGVRATMLFVASPGANFLSYPYTEPLFCLFLMGGLFFAATDRPLPAGVMGALAAATRSAGVVVCLVLVAHAWNERARLSRCAAWLVGAAVSLAGLAFYAAFCFFQYGRPLVFMDVQAGWGRHFALWGPIKAFLNFDIYPDFYLVTIVALVAAWKFSRRSRAINTLAAWFLLMLPLGTGTLTSMIRFVGANGPLFAAAGTVERPRTFTWMFVFCLVLMLYETSQYAMGFMNC